MEQHIIYQEEKAEGSFKLALKRGGIIQMYYDCSPSRKVVSKMTIRSIRGSFGFLLNFL